MLNNLSISTDVLSGLRHSTARRGENAWLIHVIPSVVDRRGADKLGIVVKTGPEGLCVLVEEVDPRREAWPADTSKVRVSSLALNEDVVDVLAC